MKRFFQILFIAFATIVLMANNVALQYIEKQNVAIFDDQNSEDGKSDEKGKDNLEEKVKEYLSSVYNTTIQGLSAYAEENYLIFELNQLPSISLDVELLPPNFS